MRSVRSAKRRRPGSHRPQRRARSLPLLPLLKQLVSIVLMFGASAGLLIVLQLLLARVDLLIVVSEAIADVIRGVQQLFEAVLGLGAVGLIAALVVLIGVLLLGGSWRSWRLLRRLLQRRRP